MLCLYTTLQVCPDALLYALAAISFFGALKLRGLHRFSPSSAGGPSSSYSNGPSFLLGILLDECLIVRASPQGRELRVSCYVRCGLTLLHG